MVMMPGQPMMAAGQHMAPMMAGGDLA